MKRTVASSGTGWCLLAAAVALAAAAPARAQECRSDQDCGEGLECDLPPQAIADCDPMAGPCEQPQPPVGECEPAELRCRSHDDCPDGLTCEIHENDCAASSTPAAPPDSQGAAGAPAPEPVDCEQPSDGECVLTLVECSDDAQCDGDDACTPLGRETRCSGGEAGCSPGEACPMDPPEETCVETTRSYCFPRLVDCSRGEACAGSTRCVALPEDALDDPPPGWEGIAALCLPEHWALALEGRIEVDGGSSASDSGSGARASSMESSGKQAADSDGEDEHGGCAVSAAGAPGRMPGLLALACSALAVMSRRRRKTRPH